MLSQEPLLHSLRFPSGLTIYLQHEAAPLLFSTSPLPGGRRLNRAARTGVSDCAGFAPNKTQLRLALSALSLTPCHPSSGSVLSLRQYRFVFSRCRSSERKNKADTGRRETTMKLEEINNRTKDAVNHLVEALESGQSEVLTQYLSAMARFHNYSFGNVMLIARQKPQATNVAGIRTWNSLGRFVKRGEKGILILAPMIGRKKADSAAEATEDAKRSQAQLYGFRAVYVFDISQTEGKDLPTLTEVQGDVSGYRERLVKFVESQGIALNYSDKIAPAKGLSHGGRITLLSGMQSAEEFSTLAHEIAHEMLHRGDRRTLTTKQVRETEAEAVAFVVCQSIGLDSGSSSADYIQIWHGDANLLRESLEAVQQTAAVILGAISPEDRQAPVQST